MTAPGIVLGSGGAGSLAETYADLLTGAAGALALPGSGPRTLVIQAGAIQSASYNAYDTGSDGGESLAEVANNASILANIATFCVANDIAVRVEAVLTPPAESFYVGAHPVNDEVNAWADAAAYAGLPVASIEDVQEVGDEDFYNSDTAQINPSDLANVAAGEALAVSTFVTEYQSVAQGADNSLVVPSAHQPALSAQQQSFTAQSYASAVAHLTVGDMEAVSGPDTGGVLQDVAAFWNDYDSVANAGTVDLYGFYDNNNGTITTSDSSTEIPSGGTVVWSDGVTILPAALAGIVNPGSIFQSGTVFEYVTPGGTAVPLTEIVEYGTTYTYVDRQSVSLGNVPALSFVTSDTGSGAAWDQGLQGLATLAAGGTVTANGSGASIGTNPTLALDVLTEAYQPAISDVQYAQQAERQAAMLAGFGVGISDLVHEQWDQSAVDVGLISSPGSWTNAAAEIAAVYPLYAAGSVTAGGQGTVAVTAPGEILLATGSAVPVGPIAVSWDSPDIVAGNRLAIVLIDQSGTLFAGAGTASAGTFGASGTFAGSGSDVLVLNGDSADLATALGALRLAEPGAGPDTIDIETFGLSGQLTDNQVSVLAQAPRGSATAFQASGNAQGWIAASAVLNSGTVAGGGSIATSETLTWNTASGAAQPAFIKTDAVHTTLSDYSVTPSGSAYTDAGSIIANTCSGGSAPTQSSWNAFFAPYSGVTELVVQSTTNTFDAAGYLCQSVDALVAPVSGTAGAALGPWGSQVTQYDTVGVTDWAYGTQFATATLTENDSGQVVEALLQGGTSGAQDEVFDPLSPSVMWEDIQTTTSAQGSVSVLVTQFDAPDNPFWDASDWGAVGTSAAAVSVELFGSGVTMPLDAGATDITVSGDADTVTGAAGSHVWVTGTADTVDLPGGGVLNESAYSTASLDGNGVVAWMNSYETLAVDGSHDTVTAASTDTVSMTGDSNAVGIAPGTVLTLNGSGDVVYGSPGSVAAGTGGTVTEQERNATLALYGNGVGVTLAAGDLVTQQTGGGDAFTFLNGGTLVMDGAASSVTAQGTAAVLVFNGGQLAVSVEGFGQVAIGNGPGTNLVLGGGVTEASLWFSQSDNNLVIQALGTDGEIVVQNWFGASSQSESVATSDGDVLDRGAIGSLVTEMAAYAVANDGLEPADTGLAPSSPAAPIDSMPRTIEAAGSTALVQILDEYELNPVSGGPGPVLRFQASPVTAGQFGAWTPTPWAPIGAERTSSGYEVAWKNAGTGLYTVWTTDSSGNYVSNTAAVTGADFSIEQVQTRFGQDLNGDGRLRAVVLTGSAGGDTVDLSAATKTAVVNLEGNTASAAAGLNAPLLAFVGSIDALTLGAPAATVEYALSPASGIETIAGFAAGLDALNIDLMGAGSSALQASDSLYNGARAISLYSSADRLHGIVLVNVPAGVTAAGLMSGHVAFSGGHALIS